MVHISGKGAAYQLLAGDIIPTYTYNMYVLYIVLQVSPI